MEIFTLSLPCIAQNTLDDEDGSDDTESVWNDDDDECRDDTTGVTEEKVNRNCVLCVTIHTTHSCVLCVTIHTRHSCV